MLPREELLDPAFLKRLEYLDFVAKKIVGGEFRGERRSTSRGHALEFRDHRTYAPGDDIRYIDWNVYLRLDELQLKEFEAEENLNIAVVVDTSDSMNFGKFNKLDYALRMAAALGYIGLSHFETVALVPHPNGTPMRIPPFRGKSQRKALLQRLSEFGPSGRGRLAETLRSLPRPLRGALLVSVISDFYDEEGFESALEGIRSRRARGLAIHLVDPLEHNPDAKGSVRLMDLETRRERVLEINENLLGRYRREFDLHLARVERYCIDAEFGFARVETSIPFDASVLSILRRGRILR
ncbi:MAG: DUF58 domain-containing protein [Planctomycetota bacterium]|jgi:uncharacterized protein (DUF58 family)